MGKTYLRFSTLVLGSLQSIGQIIWKKRDRGKEYSEISHKDMNCMNAYSIQTLICLIEPLHN